MDAMQPIELRLRDEQLSRAAVPLLAILEAAISLRSETSELFLDPILIEPAGRDGSRVRQLVDSIGREFSAPGWRASGMRLDLAIRHHRVVFAEACPFSLEASLTVDGHTWIDAVDGSDPLILDLPPSLENLAEELMGEPSG